MSKLKFFVPAESPACLGFEFRVDLAPVHSGSHTA